MKYLRRRINGFVVIKSLTLSLLLKRMGVEKRTPPANSWVYNNDVTVRISLGYFLPGATDVTNTNR
jgi:hypothetical protein